MAVTDIYTESLSWVSALGHDTICEELHTKRGDCAESASHFVLDAPAKIG